MTQPAVGIDGCPGGWVAVWVADGRPIRWQQLARIGELPEALAAHPAAVVGIDMPIGLPEGDEGRACDRLARTALGRRGVCVFSAPVRAVLSAADYPSACAQSRAVSGRALSLQSWHLTPRIRELDALWDRRPASTQLVEVHPELAFAAMTGSPLPSKHTPIGRAARLAALGEPDLSGRPRGVPVKDCLDALAAGWSARRVQDATASWLPPGPAPRDSRGRPMQLAV